MQGKRTRSTLARAFAAALLGVAGPPALSPAWSQDAGGTPPDDLFCDTRHQIATFDGTNWVCAEAERTFRYVFVTSEVYDGDLGGILEGTDSRGLPTGANGICNELAGAAELPGTYMAWIADDKHSPDTLFAKSNLPYLLTDAKTKVADDYDDLISCRGKCLDNAIVRVETGRLYGGETRVWTNVSPNGTATGTSAADSCNGWSGNSQASGATTGRVAQIGTKADWTAGDPIACTNLRRLYCFEQ